MTQTNRTPGDLAQRVVQQGLWGERPLFVIDVGCSGGIDAQWAFAGSRLRAIGFDPLRAEIERLRGANRHAGVSYEDASVTCDDYDARFPPSLRNDRIASRNNDSFQRSSAAAAQRRLQTSYVQEMFNAGAPVVVSDRTVTLDRYVAAPEDRAHVDFLKVDTDGHDIEVLLGAEETMAAGGVLGVMVEAQFHGATHDFANTFGNIDRLLRNSGFTLFDLQANRYSRAVLPAPFEWDFAGQTTSGQMLWGDAIYFRDLGSPDYERMWPYEITQERVMKLASLFDLFSLPDCAAELLLNRGAFLDRGLRDELLDLLVSGTPGSYAALRRAFDEDFTAFYRSRQAFTVSTPPAAAAAPPPPPEPITVEEPDAAGLSDALASRVTELEDENAALRKRLGQRKLRIEHLRKRIQDFKAKRAESGSGQSARRI